MVEHEKISIPKGELSGDLYDWSVVDVIGQSHDGEIMKQIILDKEYDPRLRYASVWHLIDQHEEEGNMDRLKSVFIEIFDQDENGIPIECDEVRRLAYKGFIRVNDLRPFDGDFYEEVRSKARLDPDVFINMWSRMR